MKIKRRIKKLIGIETIWNELTVLRDELEKQRDIFFTYRAQMAIQMRKMTMYQSSEGDKAQLMPDRKTIEKAYAELEKLAPVAYRQWEKLFQVNKEEYVQELPDSLSVTENVGAHRFKEFIAPWLYGNVLDIGCGPQDVPTYLLDYPLKKIYGIDPILPHKEHPFHFEQAIAEFLPWEDNSFDTILIGTSFDHVLLLDKALMEIQRSLKHDGIFLVWTSFVEGSLEYSPYTDSIEPVDRYHLFHFDKVWFEKMMCDFGFIIAEHCAINGNHYYAFRFEGEDK